MSKIIYKTVWRVTLALSTKSVEHRVFNKSNSTHLSNHQEIVFNNIFLCLKIIKSDLRVEFPLLKTVFNIFYA